MAELGTVYRYERHGVLDGLIRVRGFTQDDAHIFCRPTSCRRSYSARWSSRSSSSEASASRTSTPLSVRDEAGKYVGSLGTGTWPRTRCAGHRG